MLSAFLKEKTLENRNFPGFLIVSGIKSALGELGRAAGGLQTGLLAVGSGKPFIFNGYSD